MAATTAVSVVVTPILEVALDRLVGYLTRERPSPPAFQEEVEQLRLAMANIPSMLRVAERVPSPDDGLLDLLRQLRDASDAAYELVDELEYRVLQHQVESQLLLDAATEIQCARPVHPRSAPLPGRLLADPRLGSARAPSRSLAPDPVSGGTHDTADPTDGYALSVARDVIKALSDWRSLVRSWGSESSTSHPGASGSSSLLSCGSDVTGSTASSSNQVIGFSIPAQDESNLLHKIQPRGGNSSFTHGHDSEPAAASVPNKIGLLKQQELSYCESIRKMANRLDNIAARLEKAISLEKLDSDPVGRGESCSIRLTTSTVNEQEVHGRDGERERIIDMLLEPSYCENISVLPIFGIGGVGKTTLAQYVFSDDRIVEHFDKRVWICVSDHFDRMTITKELIASTSTCAPYHLHGSSLDSLERDLKANLEGKKLLLVLDDVWSSEWSKLLPALESCETGSKIVITAREEKVVDRMGRRNKIVLKGLQGHDYWLFFKRCAFGDEDPDKYPMQQKIGRQIAVKLHGSPLAAKTLGRLLNENLNDHHWRNILESNIWELGEGADDIMPVLKLSYMHLPAHLQRCFMHCSTFPRDYRYDVDKLVNIWIAQGLIQPKRSGKRMEDIGREYFDDLLSRSFFEQHTKLYWSSKGTYYVMHGLLHDLAYSISMGECFLYEGRLSGRIPSNVRHLCMRSLPHELNFVSACKSLQTLVMYLPIPESFFQVLTSLRVLDLSNVPVEVLPDAIGDLIHLRYLDLSHTPLKMLPESLCQLYHLQTLIVPNACTLPEQMADLINLRHLTASGEVLSMVNCIGRLTSLQELKEFHVKRSRGHDVGQLKDMRELGGQLRILNLEIVGSKEEAAEANLKEKNRLNKLQLQWMDSADDWSNVQEKVLEGLEPHSNLKVLEIKGYMGRHSPSWLGIASLENIQSVHLIECKRWSRLPSLGQLPFLQILYMEGMHTTVDGDDEVAVVFPTLKELWLESSSVFFQGMSVKQGREFFPCLQKLHVRSCNQLKGLPFSRLSALEELNISGSPDLDGELPRCLEGLESLTSLSISRQKIAHLPKEVMRTLASLQKLRIKHCPELISLEGLQALGSLKRLEILSCPKLQSWLPNGDEDALPAGLHTLEINHCRSLKSLPALPVGLHSLQIKDCRSLESGAGLPMGLPRFTFLRKFVVDGCPKLPPLSKHGHRSGPKEGSSSKRF